MFLMSDFFENKTILTLQQPRDAASVAVAIPVYIDP